MPHILKCEHCHTTFETVVRTQRFCSKRCSGSATYDDSRRIQPRACAYCGMVFLPKTGKKMCCSRSCAGRLTMSLKPRIPAEVRFWKHVKKTRTCWLWTGGADENGYGRFGVTSDNVVLAHRYSYSLVHDLDPEICVLHKCDNPSCVRPAHLWTGTRGDNLRDCIAKGRFTTGMKHHGAKLTDNQVRQIRKLAAAGKTSQADIARRFGLDQSTVSQIVNFKRRKHVK